jgi:hypothetical protein
MKTPVSFPRRDGAALVIVLFFIILISIMAVGLLDSTRLERTASASHFERARAASLAREGVEDTVALLQRETTTKYQVTNPDGTKSWHYNSWTSQPGALIVPKQSPNPLPPTLPPGLYTELHREVLLNSGAPTPGFMAKANEVDPALLPVNLNIQTLIDQSPRTYLITDREEPSAADPNKTEPIKMNLRWIYVRKDGSRDLKEEPDLTKGNPVIGRFAYWADDESSKINYNLAWKRDTAQTLPASSNTSQEAHPSRINLMGLTVAGGTQMTEAMADSIHNWTTMSPGRSFNSYADARQVSPEVAAMLNYNKFELTHFNHDPDTTFFGEDRIMLTMNKKLVPKNPDGTYARKFLDILRDDLPNPDPGNLDHIAGGQPDFGANSNGSVILPNKFDAAVRTLMNYISNTNWPLSPGASFKTKYNYTATAELGQIAVNIIDYIRAKESPTLVIAPLRFAVDPNGKFTLHPTHTYGAANSYQGISRAPYITEMKVYVEATPTTLSPKPSGWPNEPNGQTKPLYKTYFTSELYIPPNYGFDDPNDFIELVPDPSTRPASGSEGWFVTWTETRDPKKSKYYFQSPNGQMVLMENHGQNAVRVMRGDVVGGDGPNQTVMRGGRYVSVTKVFYRDNPWSSHSTLEIRGVLYKGTSGSDGLLAGPLNRWPRVNIGTQTGSILYPISNPHVVGPGSAVSIETDDPRCNVSPKDWRPNKSGTNTIGTQNSWYSVGQNPANIRPQQDTDKNGKISSYSLYMPPKLGRGSNDAAHDNGRLTSIAELGYIHTGNNTKAGSTSWRTIRLQPNNYLDSKTLPDWAFMDLFSVPTTGATVSQPIFTPHGTSVGGRVNVNAHVEPFDKMTRDRGLVALLTGTRLLPNVEQAQVVATNISQRTLATGPNPGKVFGYPWKANPSPTETNTFDTPGEICEIKGVADGGEESEDLIREISSLVTARGGVFSVYTVGQSLKQTPQGKLVVTAEQRQQATIERYVENRGTPDSIDDEIRFRTVYYRNLTP